MDFHLGSLQSVARAAQTFAAAVDRLEILLLNGGIMDVAPGLTKDGYEMQFGTNHIGHALLLSFSLLSCSTRRPHRHHP